MAYTAKLFYEQTGGKIYRTVNGKTDNIVVNQWGWGYKDGEVRYSEQSGILILYSLGYSKPSMALRNYTGKSTVGLHVSTVAKLVGTYNWEGVPLELWDCGTQATTKELEMVKAEEAAQQAALDEQKEQARKVAASIDYTNQAKAIIWLQKESTNGSPSAQYGLGIHYLNGQGCETNTEQAIYWLTQAANQGSFEASNKLTSINLLYVTHKREDDDSGRTQDASQNGADASR